MKFKKLILPMMAIIFAIGLAFANVDMKTEPKMLANDYIRAGGSWEAIPEQNCGTGNLTCRVQLEEGGNSFQVYDEMNTSTLKTGDGSVRKLYE